jgi:hypothetical protein
MELLGDVGEVDAHFGPLGHGANFSARFAPNVPWAQGSFWPHPMHLQGEVGQMKAHFGPFGDSVNLDAR